MHAFRIPLVFVAAAAAFGLSVANAQTCPLSPQLLLPAVCYEEVSLCSVRQTLGNEEQVTRTFARVDGAVRVTTASGEETPSLAATCTFDARDRLVRFEAAHAPHQIFAYDAAGRITRVDLHADGATKPTESCVYSYESESGELAWHDHLGEGVTTHRVFYHYDAAGRLAATTRDHRLDGSINGPRYGFEYENDRLVREGTDRYTTRYRYDAEGKQTVVERLVAGKVTGQELATYDAEGRLASLRMSKHGHLERLESRSYDIHGRLESVVLTGGNGSVIERSERAYGCGPGEQLSSL